MKSARGLAQSKTWRIFVRSSSSRSVLDCANPLALFPHQSSGLPIGCLWAPVAALRNCCKVPTRIAVPECRVSHPCKYDNLND